MTLSFQSENKYDRLLSKLQSLVHSEEADDVTRSWEVIQFFMQRLSSQQRHARQQAQKVQLLSSVSNSLCACYHSLLCIGLVAGSLKKSPQYFRLGNESPLRLIEQRRRR